MSEIAATGMSDRDKRALKILAFALIVALGFWFYKKQADVAAEVSSINPEDPQAVDIAIRRLESARRHAITAPLRKKELDRIASELKRREVGLMNAETTPQLLAQLLQSARRIALNQPSPMILSPMETGSIKPLGEHYGQAELAVAANCRIEQLVNFLSGVSTQRDLVTVESVQVTSAGGNQKLINVRMVLTAVVPKRLIPKKG
jgi:Tfp pilus assembly protein PilO